jgi:NitT/TauT family transport system ATP-binding protein
MAASLASRPMIALSNVTRTFRRADGQVVRAVDDVSFAVPAGQFVCLVGPSGCGKSTLLQLVAGLLSPSDGRVEVDARPVTAPGAERGMVFQKDSVFPWMRVIDNVEYGLKCRAVPATERRSVATRYLERVGLAHVARAWPRELSGGMLKRVAVATVFANGARVLMLDEPFGALDYVTRHQLHDVLLDLWGEAGSESRRTVLFVTHDVDEALTLADRILVFRDGRQVDDLAVAADRPRTTDSLLLPELVRIKHTLLAHLGLERGAAAHKPAASAKEAAA